MTGKHTGEGELRTFKQYASLAEIGRIITSSMDIDGIYERFANEVRALIPFDRIAINLIDLENGIYRSAYVSGQDVPSRRPGDIIPLENSMTEKILLTGEGGFSNVHTLDDLPPGIPGLVDLFNTGLRSFINVPLKSNGSIIGCLNLVSRVEDAYAESHLRLAESVAAQIAGAIANAQLYDSVRHAEEAERRAAHENAALAEIGRIISSSLDIEEVYDRFAEQVSTLVPFDRLAITVLDEEQEIIQWSYIKGSEVLGEMRGNIRTLKGTFTERVIKSGSSVLFQTEEEDEFIREFPSNLLFFEAGFRSFMAVPLISKDKFIGALHIRSTTINAYTNEDVALAERVATQIAGAIVIAQLYDSVRQAEEAERQLATENACLAGIGRIISSSLDIYEVYERFANEVHNLIFIDVIAIVLINEANDSWRVAFFHSELEGFSPNVGECGRYTDSFASRIIDTRISVLTQTEDRNEFSKERPCGSALFEAGLRSAMAIPLISSDGAAIGVLHFGSIMVNAYSEKELALAERVAAQIAGAIANSQLHGELLNAEEAERQLASENAVIAELGRIISSSLDIDTVYESFAEQTRTVIPFERVSITLLDESRENFVLSYLSGVEIPGSIRDDIRPLSGSFTGRVTHTRSSLLLQVEHVDELQDFTLQGSPHFDAGMRSFLAIPLVSNDQVIGALHFRSSVLNAYTERDVAFAERVGLQIAGAIANSQLHSATREAETVEHRLAQENACLAEIGRIISSSLDIEEVYDRFAEQVSTLVPFDRLAITVLDEEQENIRWTYHQGIEVPGMRPGNVFRFEGSFIERVIKSGSSVLFQTEEEDEFIREFPLNLPFFKTGFRSFISAPLIFKDKFIGALHIRSTTINAYTTKDVALAERVATQIAGGIANAQLYAELNQAQHSKVQAEEKYRNLIESSIDSIIVLKDGKTVYRNHIYQELMGFSVEETADQSFLDMVAPEDREQVREYYQSRLQGDDVPDQYEVRLLTRDKRSVVMEVKPIIIEYEGQPATMVTMRDITQRKVAEEALQEIQSRFIQVAENIPQAFWLFDPVAHQFLYLSSHIEEVFSTKVSELYKNADLFWQELVHPEDRERVHDVLRDHRVERQFECRILLQDGSVRWLWILRSPLMNEDGEVYRIVGVAQDITERKLMEEQLIQSQKMEAVGQLAGGVAHDFNNLLTAILAYSHLGVMKLPKGDPVAGYMEEIKKAGERAARLTSQLLAFSRRQISEPRVLSLNEISLDTNKMLRRLIGEDVELVVLPSDDLWLIEVDPGQIEQVLINLAVNARDAMPDGGKLTIATANARIDDGFARLHSGLSEGEYVTLSVRDTGTGISEEVMEHIFEPFFTTKEVGKGTGLGLAMCYGIVTQSGGGIVVDSELDKGTTFTIYLPRVDVPATSMPLHDESGYLPAGSETVLLVEDEPALLNVAAHVLREQGYTVLEATNGTDALRVSEECADQVIHLLLTDVVMPLMGGRELADKLRVIRPDMSVLFASGYTDDAVVSRDITEGSTQFLQKPFTPSDLARKVRESIQIR